MKSNIYKSFTLTAVIISKNEELHIERCIKSLKKHVDKIVVIDSGSTDNTKEIALTNGAEFLFNKWEGYSKQINWAIDKVSKYSDWIIRVDADEVLNSTKLICKDYLKNLPSNVNGLTIKRNIFFNRSLIKYGGMSNQKIIRIFRSGFRKCDNRDMDEHFLVLPKIIDSPFVLSDISLIDFKNFVIKHIDYAYLEVNSINQKEESQNVFKYNASTNLKKNLKKYVFYKIPSRLRPFLYFLYRMLIKKGIFENTKGFYYHLFQGLMYRSFVEYLYYLKRLESKE